MPVLPPPLLFVIMPCGGRGSAYKSSRITIAEGEAAMLLVDSEKPLGSQNSSE